MKRTQRDVAITLPSVPWPMRNLIDTAARKVGLTRSDFIVEAAYYRALDVMGLLMDDPNP